MISYVFKHYFLHIIPFDIVDRFIYNVYMFHGFKVENAVGEPGHDARKPVRQLIYCRKLVYLRQVLEIETEDLLDIGPSFQRSSRQKYDEFQYPGPDDFKIPA